MCRYGRFSVQAQLLIGVKNQNIPAALSAPTFHPRLKAEVFRSIPDKSRAGYGAEGRSSLAVLTPRKVTVDKLHFYVPPGGLQLSIPEVDFEPVGDDRAIIAAVIGGQYDDIAELFSTGLSHLVSCNDTAKRARLIA
ncbi:hypothetical protein [Burkholderia multivorans]|uniref:hypothetical protein n=1 Tax=Burkholderia multivorans TaxID=87883 RepID=UPI001C24DA00|nr:hypothetical protein [Burkholderia multivorans]MBU9212429.1 hypothetical protein [Burkholderia multivorans]